MRATRSQARRAALYGIALAAGALGLQWLDYHYLTRTYPAEIYVALICAAFLGIGLYAGKRLFGAAPVPPFAGNPQAQAALGISPRELDVLKALADGRSNKEIARALDVSPNTVKTHVSRLFEKLGARRRTDAINKARDLGLLP